MLIDLIFLLYALMKICQLRIVELTSNKINYDKIRMKNKVKIVNVINVGFRIS